MYPTSTTNFSRYRNNNHTVEIHNSYKCNPLADLSLQHNYATATPMQTYSQAENPTLTKSLNKHIRATLKDREKEYVGDANYYAGLNRHGLPENVHQQLNETLGRTKSRLIRGESLARETAQRGAPVPHKKEDFLDRFIKRQYQRQDYYKNTEKLETLKCDKHPQFLTNSEFVPGGMDNDSEFDARAFASMKKSRMLPNSVIVDANVREMRVEREWARNYGDVLNSQKIFKDVNYMELNKYNALSKKISGPYVRTEHGAADVDPVLKDAIMDLYNQI